jgi:predicted dehydrogenase
VRTYRVALIGCRARGTSQARAIVAHPRTELVAICDLLPERLHALGDRFDVSAGARYADFERMIRETQPDIVNIPTATRFHAPLAEAALRLGCHVDVEKPLTLTLEEVDRLLAAQRASGKQLVAHHQSAVGPVESKLRRLVREGFVGAPQAVRVRNKGYYGGFGIIHQGCHALALISTIVGPARAVSAHMRTGGHPTTVDEVYPAPYGYGLVAGEHLTCLYDMEGSVYLIDEDHYRPEVDSSTDRIEFVGTDGALALEYHQPGRVRLSHSETPHWHPAQGAWDEITVPEAESSIAGLGVLDPTVRGEDIWLVEEWVRALDEGREHVVNAAVGAGTMEMIFGAYASHAEGRRVDLPQVDRSHPLERWLTREGRPLPPPAPPDYAAWIAWALGRARPAERDGVQPAESTAGDAALAGAGTEPR